ncbi:MAG: toprim domain-containing protein [Methanosarcinales archaeon]|nr:MAG: toprim domain-containing protein [Methanosarcinales archaeon]
MDKEKRLEHVKELIKELGICSLDGAVVVVEGRRDKHTLRNLGVAGRIVFATYDPIFSFSEKLSQMNNEIIILTDWDRAGEKLAKKLMQHLLSFGIVPNMRFHRLLSSLVRKDIKDVEGLDSYIDRLQYNTQSSSNWKYRKSYTFL